MKILLISHIYPSMDYVNENRDSLFLHLYARQWAAKGNEVRVEHMALNYPIMFNSICYKIQKLKKYKIPWCNYKAKKYEFEKVIINRIPLLKIVPHGKYQKSRLEDVFKKIEQDLQSSSFEPDIILCDYINPGLQILNRIRKNYPARTYAIIHNADVCFLNKHKNYALKEKLEKLSGIGFRSKSLLQRLDKGIVLPDIFYIPSGIPQEYSIKRIAPRHSIKKILIVSTFIERKHIDCVIKAVHNLNSVTKSKYQLSIVGEGGLYSKLTKLADTLDGKKWCKFEGKLSRDHVFEKMRESDVFVLLSEGETFGMVYVEAMSQGCITIGSLKEGIDGVIEDGKNGFLLPAGDADALVNCIKKLETYTAEQISNISQAGMNTAASMTDEELASGILRTMCKIE